jgi:outer membrane protein TolC
VRAAEANLGQAQRSAALDVSVSSLARSEDPLPLTDARLEVGVTAYPFVYGQLGDTLRLREIELEQARLDQRQALVGLEVRALESALELVLARRSLELARTSAAAAEASYQATRLRFRRGVATAGELRDADAGQRETQNFVSGAEADLALAEATLTGLVGEPRLETVPELAIPQGEPVTLRDAEFAVASARIGQAGAGRQFYPVAEVTYDYNVSARGRVTASITSADLAPRVGYSLDNDGYAGDGGLSLRVSASLAPDQFQNVARLDELLRAAEASLRAAQRDAVTAEGAIRNRWAEAGRNRELSAFIFQNAERSLAEVRRREQLGVSSPLETQGAAVALAEAGVELRDARREQFAALLDLYEFYGLPISETLAAPQETLP